MPEISSADFQLFQEYMKSRAPAPAPAPAPAAPEVKTIDECLMTFRDCVVGKDQAMAMAPASSTSMALAPAPASSTSMALAPATAADGFAVGVSVNCKANDPSTATITGGAGGGGTKVYRYMGSKTINHYPNPDVAASWNPSWGSINTIDCAGLTVGPTMTLAPATAAAVVATPSVLSSGQEIQKGELTITTSPVPVVSTQPTGITASGSFTLSIDINMTTLPNGSLLRVIGQGVHPGQPGLWLFPAGAGGNVWLRFHVGNSAVDLVTDKTPPTYNTYYNITAVYDGTTRQATLYHNGVLTGSAAIDPTGFAPPTPAMFGWNQQNLTAPTVKVKNTYWFNKALTAAEIKTIASPAGSGTSGYAHEGSPFGGLVGRRNWRLVLILFLLVIMLWIIAKKM